MEEVKLWNVVNREGGRPAVQAVESVAQTATEQLLEEILTNSPEVLMNGLTLVGRQNETAGGPLDLLGVDEDGRLVVFELKRGTLTRDAVAQVVDYASYLDSLGIDELNQHVSQMSGRGGIEQIDDFGRWYQENYSVPLSDIGIPRMVLVGLGVDERAKRMVEFLATANLDISLITFYGFTRDGQTLLARQVEVQARAEKSTNSSKRRNEDELERRLETHGVRALYMDLAAKLKGSMGESVYQWPNPTGYTFSLPEITDAGNSSNRAYVSIYVPESFPKKRKLQLFLQQRVVEGAGKARLQAVANRLGGSMVVKPAGWADILLDGNRPGPDFQQGLAELGALCLDVWQTRRRAQEDGRHDSEDGVDAS